MSGTEVRAKGQRSGNRDRGQMSGTEVRAKGQRSGNRDRGQMSGSEVRAQGQRSEVRAQGQSSEVRDRVQRSGNRDRGQRSGHRDRAQCKGTEIRGQGTGTEVRVDMVIRRGLVRLLVIMVVFLLFWSYGLVIHGEMTLHHGNTLLCLKLPQRLSCETWLKKVYISLGYGILTWI